MYCCAVRRTYRGGGGDGVGGGEGGDAVGGRGGGGGGNGQAAAAAAARLFVLALLQLLGERVEALALGALRAAALALLPHPWREAVLRVRELEAVVRLVVVVVVVNLGHPPVEGLRVEVALCQHQHRGARE